MLNCTEAVLTAIRFEKKLNEAEMMRVAPKVDAVVVSGWREVVTTFSILEAVVRQPVKY
jgi:hypothetical protein